MKHTLTSLLAAAFGLALPLTGFGNVLITEIMYNAAGTDTGFEWVEIYNSGAVAVDVSGWMLRDEDSNSVNWGAIPAATILNPGQALIITQSSEADFKAAWPTAAEALIYTSAGWGSIANTVTDPGNEVMTILDSLEGIIDVVDYLTVAPWPENINGSSIYLLPGAFDPTSNDDGANWAGSLVGVHGAISPLEGGTYDLGNIASPGVVVVPEASTFAMVLGLLSFAWIMVRRRR